MPRGDKSSYTNKHRQARHSEDGYETRGLSTARSPSAKKLTPKWRGH